MRYYHINLYAFSHRNPDLYQTGRRLRDSNADLRARLAVAEALLTEREHPTDGVNVEGEQVPNVQVNDQGERTPRTWWQRLFLR